MTPTLIPAAALVAITAGGMLALRRLSELARVAFDVVCFAAISAYLLDEDVAPIFPPLSELVDSHALWMRAVAGAWWLLGARILVFGLRFALRRESRSSETRLFSDLSAAVIYIATASVVLSSVFAIPLAGLVATSGVVAIVLGLALQNTLADVFAGIAVGIEAPFRVGDRIVIGDKTEGYVVQVNWRSIRIRTDSDDVTTIPNSLVAKAEIANRTYPLRKTTSSVEIPYPARAAPERVIETMLDATRLCGGILRSPAPSAFLVRLGERHSVYKILFTIESADQIAATRDSLLRGVRRQLHYAELVDPGLHRPTRADSGSAALVAQSLLSEMVLFESLSQAQLEGLVGRLQPQRMAAEGVLFAQGAMDATLYILASGVVEISRQSGVVSEVIGCIGAGEYIGEIGLLTGAPHAATAVALTHCLVYQLKREAIELLLSESPELATCFDHSVRRGLEILHREVAVRATPSIGPRDQLLARIRSIFHLDFA